MSSYAVAEDDWVRSIEEARLRISGVVARTPVAKVLDGAQRFGSARVYLKLENLQKTGSFKLRGATNKVMSLTLAEAERGVVTSSSGNHGLGVATAARHRGIDAEVFLSTHVSAEKQGWLKKLGARVRLVGENPLEAELAARAAAASSGRIYISPYNDPLVVAGQGTIAAELTEQLSHIDAVYVSVGGGGLIAGIGAYLTAVRSGIEVIGCWPHNSRVMYESLMAGRIIELPEQPTLSESTAGGVEPGSITFPLCQKVVHRHILVSESEILDAMRWARERLWIVEGAAGVAIAAAFKDADRCHGKTVVIISCGGNISLELADRVS